MSHFNYQPAYRRNLPHIQPPGATFFVTFRLDGSIPQTVVRQWNREREWLTHLARTNPTHYDEVKRDFERAWFKKFELLLDGATVGPVWLNDERVASVVAESLHYRHGRVYRLDAFTIMSNHVHTVIKPLPVGQGEDTLLNLGAKDSPADDVEYQSLAAIMQSLKGYTAFRANQLLGREGEFWAHESYDHWIRDNDEWQRIVAYVLNNPLKAGYVKRWQDWTWNYRRV
jgi:putative transposase